MEEKKSVLKSFGKEILIGVTVTLIGLVFSNYKSWSTKDFTPTRPRLQRGRSRIAFVMLFKHLNKLPSREDFGSKSRVKNGRI